MQAIAWDLFVKFVTLGHEVTVLTTEISNRQDPFVASGVKVVPLRGTKSERYTRAWWRLSARYASSNLSNFDAVLSISTAGASLRSSSDEARYVPVISQIHGTSYGEMLSKWRTGRPVQYLKSIKNFYWLYKDAFLFQKFDRLVLVGDSLSQDIDRLPTRWIVRGIPTTLIRNGIDTEVFKRHEPTRAQVRRRCNWDESTFVFAFAARLHSQKGAAEAIKAMAQIPSAGRKKFHLLVIGGGEEERALKGLTHALSLNDKITFAGPVLRPDVPDLLASADAFVFPSLRQEGLPMNILEALAMGLPCVCSDTMKDAFPPNLPIKYAAPSKTRELARAMLECASADSDGASLLPPEFSLQFCADSYIQLFQSMRASE